MAMKSLDDLFMHFLQDMYNAEKQEMKALPKMAKKADSDQLRSAFEQHLEQTKGHVERLEKVFESLDKKAKGVPCKAMEGIMGESEEIMGEVQDADALDAAMIAAAQAVEHYEITRYGTMVAWAKQLGHKEAASLLEKTLDEEFETDKKLSGLAEKSLNRQAA